MYFIVKIVKLFLLFVVEIASNPLYFLILILNYGFYSLDKTEQKPE